MRDREYAREKPDGVYRIIVPGDSIAAGHSLPIEKAFPDQLEALFAARDMKVEVLNLSVDGYETTQEVTALEYKGLQFDPDEVILAYCMNDIGSQSGSLDYIIKARKFGVPYVDLRLLQFLIFEVNRLLGTVEPQFYAEVAVPPGLESDGFVTERVRAITHYVESTDFPRNTWGSLTWYGDLELIARLRAALDKLKALSEVHGFKAKLLLLPYLVDPVPAHGLAYDLVRRESRAAGLEVVEVLDIFEREGLDTVRFGPGDPVHPNPHGHEVIAETLFEAHGLPPR